MSSAAVAGGSAAATGIELSVRGMTCAACAARVEKKLNSLEDVRATVNFATDRASVCAPAGTRPAMLIAAIEQAGYGAALARPPAGSAAADEAGDAGHQDDDYAGYLRRRLILALIFFIPLSDVSVALSLFPSFRFPGWQWVLVALAAPVALWAAWPFHRAALRNARHRSLSMDTLVSIAAAPARAASTSSSRGGGVGHDFPARWPVLRGPRPGDRRRRHARACRDRGQGRLRARHRWQRAPRAGR